MHKARNIVIKTADVDEGIIPVVEWLNGYGDVFTRWSCEGEEEPQNSFDRPMVVFCCEGSFTLATILLYLKTFATIECEFYEYIGGIRYIIWFNSKEALRLFIEKLPELRKL